MYTLARKCICVAVPTVTTPAKAVVTAVNGAAYTVEVYDGEFIPGETVSIFRTERHKSSSRIGRGELARADSIAVSAASGSIVSMAVSDGDEVKRGDLLFETVDGTFDGLIATGNAITAPVDGSVASINVTASAQVAEGMAVATIYPAGAMRIEAEVDRIRPQLHFRGRQGMESSWTGTATRTLSMTA